MTLQRYDVRLDWCTAGGNPATRSEVIEATSPLAAIAILEYKIRNRSRDISKVDGIARLIGEVQ